MNILSAQNLSKSYGVKLLFANVSFGIDERDRIGMIGANGSGKSTLLKILARLEPCDEGILAVRQDLRVAYLPQSPLLNGDQTVIEHLFASDRPAVRLAREYETICRQLSKAREDESLLKRFDDLSRRMEAAGAWEYETQAKTILTKLGIEDFDARIQALSGGYRKRVALAHALLAESDLLILDEPTNHLDADTIDWLENYLMRYNGALVLVTHDRYFLDRVTRRMMELDHGQLRFFDGSFTYYLEKKAEIEEAEATAENRRRAILKNELAWFRRGARARRTKEKARIHHIRELREAPQAQARDAIRFDTATRRLGKKILEIRDLSKSFGEKTLIRHFSHVFTRGERLGAIGPNGSGKTTLANMIIGREPLDGGVIDVGETVHFGYYDQESGPLDLNERAIDYIKREGGEMLRASDGSVLTAAAFLERFWFTPQMLYAPIGKLSGGERRRLYLVRTLLLDPNFLILDEPANDLDLLTLQALEDFLDGFGGCLLVISHDRFFLDRTVDRLLVFEEEGRLKLYPGGYIDYAEMRAEERSVRPLAPSSATRRSKEAAQPRPETPAPAAPTQPSPRRKLSYKEQRELEALEEAIPRLENRREELTRALAAAAADYPKLRALSEEQATLVQKIEEAMTRWEELAGR